MRIGFSGRIGVGLIAFAAIADGATWLVRAFDNYPFDFYRLSDAYLPLVFIFGLALLMPSISIDFQTRRAANLAKFPLTLTGPLPPKLGGDSSQSESPEWACAGASDSASRKHPQPSDEIPAPRIVIVSSPPYRRLSQWLGAALLVLAMILYEFTLRWIATSAAAHPRVVFAYADSYEQFHDVVDLFFCFLVVMGIALLAWPHIREMQGVSLGVEPRTIRTGMVDPVHMAWKSAARAKLLLHHPAAACAVGSALVFVLPLFMLTIPLNPHGLLVYIPKPGTYALPSDMPWGQPLVVGIDAQGNLYLNRKLMLLADLGPWLQFAFKTRADRTVYLDGDPEAAAGRVIEVADIALGAGATKIILVTPSMEKEKPELAVKSPCESKLRHVQGLKLPPKWRTHGFYDYYDYPAVSFVVEESGQVSNITLQRKGNIPELVDPLVNSARRLRYPPVPGCGKHELYLGYSW